MTVDTESWFIKDAGGCKSTQEQHLVTSEGGHTHTRAHTHSHHPPVLSPSPGLLLPMSFQSPPGGQAAVFPQEVLAEMSMWVAMM